MCLGSCADYCLLNHNRILCVFFVGFFLLHEIMESLFFPTVFKPTNPPSRLNTCCFLLFLTALPQVHVPTGYLLHLNKAVLIFVKATINFSSSLHYTKEKDFYFSSLSCSRGEHSSGKVLAVLYIAHSYPLMWFL